MVLTALLIMCYDDARGADWRAEYNFPAVYDTAYTCFYEDDVLQDSSAGRADDNDYDTIFTYTAGSYLKCILWYKYDATDEWGTWTKDYYSATAAGVDYGRVYDTGAVLLTDSSHLFGGGSGGPYTVTFLTWDSTTVLAVPTVSLTIRPVDQSTHTDGITTGPNGYGSANLTADSFVVIESEAGWTQDNILDTIVVVDVTDTFTIYMDQYAPDAPAGANYCAVWGYLSEIRDSPSLKTKRVKVTFTPTKAVNNVCENTGLIVGSATAETDDAGYFAQNLLYSSCMLDGADSIQYKVTVEGYDRSWLITVPDGVSHQVDFQD